MQIAVKVEEMPHDRLVSIVINNFNYARYLDRAITSALNQTYPAIEVVVVDDGSIDESASVIARHRQRCVVVTQPNLGQGGAYNAGFRASSGEAVLFLDADDALYPDAVASAMARWSPDVAKVQFYLDVVDETERPLGHRRPNIAFAPGPVDPLLRFYGYYPSPPSSGNLYARHVLQRILPMDTDLWRKGADGYTIALAALYGRVVSIDRALGVYRVHGANQSEVGGIDVALLRRRINNELDREAALRAHATAMGHPITSALSLNIPQHCKARLLSLRLAPAHHPVPDDSVGGLLRAALAATWRFPHSNAAKRLLATAVFLALPALPRRWLARHLDPIFRSEIRLDYLLGRRRNAAADRAAP